MADENVVNVTDPKAVLRRDLEDSWARIAERIVVDTHTLAMMEKVYWHGVMTGVGVFHKAMQR